MDWESFSLADGKHIWDLGSEDTRIIWLCIQVIDASISTGNEDICRWSLACYVRISCYNSIRGEQIPCDTKMKIFVADRWYVKLHRCQWRYLSPMVACYVRISCYTTNRGEQIFRDTTTKRFVADRCQLWSHIMLHQHQGWEKFSRHYNKDNCRWSLPCYDRISC